MTDIIDRLRFDAARCEATFSKGVATNIEEAMAEIERLRAALQTIAENKLGHSAEQLCWFASVTIQQGMDNSK